MRRAIEMEYLTTPVATSMKHPTKSPVDGGFPDGSLLTFERFLTILNHAPLGAHLGVHLVNPHEIAALPIDTLGDSSVVVQALNGAGADTVLAEVVRVQVILGCHLRKDDFQFHPNVGRVLPSPRRCRPGPVPGRSSRHRSTR